jgi:hypothetical protein
MQPLRRLSERYGVELYVKRDDLSGIALSGNKIRKLEFVLADALAQKIDTVITRQIPRRWKAIFCWITCPGPRLCGLPRMNTGSGTN